MKNITAFNKITTAAFRSDLSAVLAKYGMTSNLDMKIGTIRFSGADARMQITAKVKGAVTKEDRLLEAQIAKHNLREVNGVGEKLVGYNARASRYPFVYTLGGKRYKASLGNVKVLFGK